MEFSSHSFRTGIQDFLKRNGLHSGSSHCARGVRVITPRISTAEKKAQFCGPYFTERAADLAPVYRGTVLHMEKEADG